MSRKRMLVTGLVLVVFALLVYLQFRTWKSFDWAKFLQYRPDWHHILHGIIFIYLAYFLRAVRWKIFLRPVRKHTTVMNMVPPTIIGFTALALLGRPGELIRPYLVARRENLSFASQLAVWAVERIFDIGGFTVLMLAAIFLPSKLRAFMALRPSYHHALHVMGYVLAALVIGLFTLAMLMAFKGPAMADRIETHFSP